MIALAGLLTLVTTLLIVSCIGAVALEATGMTRDSAEFQARSALLGVGFTTSEAEDITSHPVRRKIVLYLMTVGNASVVAGIASFLLAFLDAETQQTVRRTGILTVGVIVIIAAFHTGLANRVIQRITHAMLRRYTELDIQDYAALLRVENDYAITELHARDGEWLVGRPLSELHLTREGVVILGVHRADGAFLGAPTGETVIENDDYAPAYGRVGVLQELANRPAATGDQIHNQVTAEHKRILADE
ncbi:MAG: TrkA C-terminal domain-containing protein [Acidimicrobiales bacterium]